MQKTRILVVDDEKLVCRSLQKSLSKEGYTVVTAENGTNGLKLFREEQPDITLLDIHLPDVSGITVLEGIKEINRDALVIMITAYGNTQTAVKTIKLGAYDFVEKPFNIDKLKILIKKALETITLRKEVMQFRSELSARYGFDSIIGQSEDTKKILKLIKKVAESDATTIFLQGESGTGKDLVARVIHYQSRRANMPFMEINCTALPETLIESELFGYEKGAFTDAKTTKKGLFELADGGTVYLDEIGDMKLSTQVKLLKVIEDKMFKRIGGTKDITVNVRIIAATNKDPADEVKRGNFREDLYYRLKVIPIVVSPLREKKDDILLLAKYFINEFNREFRKNFKGISKEAEKYFLNYPWPGNVRELKNVIERTMILENEDYILPEHLPVELMADKGVVSPLVKALEIKIPASGIAIEKVERDLIKHALEMTNGNQTKAARMLNLTRDTLRYRMQKYGLLQKET